MTFDNFQESYLALSDFEYKVYQLRSFQFGCLLKVLFQNLSQKNLCQRLAHPQKPHSWNFLGHRLFSNLNYRQINSFLFDSNYHLFFRNYEEMDFVADYGLMNFDRHLLKRFHCLIIVLLISKETSMSALQLKVAQTPHVNYLFIIVIKVGTSLLDLMEIGFSYFNLAFFESHLIPFQKISQKLFKFVLRQLKN